MRLWDRLRERRAARREEHERRAEEDLEALARGEIEDLPSHRRKVRHEHGENGFPSAGAGYLPPP